MLGWRPLGRQFEWLWAAYAVSAYGTMLGFGAFPLIAIRVLHDGPAQVAALPAAGLAAGAVLAVPLGPWVEFRRKRPVMIAMDLARFAAMLSIPVTYALGWLTFAQLVVVAMITATARIAFRAASGACLKTLVQPGQLLAANARFESTTWTATVVGPPLGGALIGLLGPVVTVLADAVSYLLSAAGIAAIGGGEPRPAAGGAARVRGRDLLDGWRHILASPVQRALFLNSVSTGGLILATEPALAVLMLSRLGFAPWQYGLAFAAPCVGGLAGARLSRPLVARYGQHRVLRVTGTLRALWPVGLAFTGRGAPGVILVIVLQLALVTCMGVFNPVYATCRLEQTPADWVARTLSAWTVTSTAATAVLTALWGGLAALAGPRAAIAAAGVLLLFTPLLLPRRLAGYPAAPAVSSTSG